VNGDHINAVHDDALLRRRAKRGASSLDKKFPNWFRRIRLSTLALESLTSCVLGQLHNGDYDLGLRKFLGLEELMVGSRERAVKFGFAAGSCLRDDCDGHCIGARYSVLTEAWLGEIRARRAPATKAAGAR
jgi:hypothetical protein